ncbi:MAG: pyruvate kinase [Proteobacteria bacterium]|nr:pyruvate kinase [Pseudomonadota bacterium]MBU1389197.1 pyruvate kinase [Pseudomonadota bacterium]MBU1543421.1 pyruvate kinase [Pseudomonadota bacterium]MBU2430612.1 pyruvate kinase [Pseudomonadota bacterium]MBU2482604.1 pyruvate kinase [Pseudomonadota bacterium]
MRRNTKIVATISNLNCSPDFIKGLFWAGINVVRLNTAHMNHDDALQVIENTRKVSDKIGILLDTKGPEIRTCDTKMPLSVKSGDTIRIKAAPNEKSEGDIICVSYENFVHDVPVGSSILIDDGCIALAVMEKNQDYLFCYVENDGEVKARKSINIPSVHVKLPALSEKDKGFIRFAADHDLDFIAHSFVRNAEDVIAVQKILDEKNSPIKIIAKIENAQGVENLSEILDHAYGIMIARGDLAVEIPTEQIPLIQKQIVKTCVERRKPVIVATQMLHSMIESPRPTRAEVSDVANACLDHADALMLSGETASGKYPEVAVQTMAKIAREVESKKSSFINVPYTLENKITAYLAKSAVKASLRLNTKAIVADSLTGSSILALAAYRGDSPIFAQVYDRRVMRRLSLSFGVIADYIEIDDNPFKPIKKAILRLIEEKQIKAEDLIIVLAGSFGPKHGASFIEVSTAGNFKDKTD